MEAKMLHEQVINVLETVVVVLTLTNAISIAAAAYAIALAQDAGDGARPLVQPALLAVLTRRRGTRS
jgi:hypothetical protein